MTEAQTAEEHQVWELISSANGIFKIGGMGGVTGFDITAILAVINAYGWQPKVMLDLLMSIEGAAVQAINSNIEAKS